MPPVPLKNPRFKVSAGTVKAVVFLLLIGITIAFWLYTQKIFNQVRGFQESVVNTQVQIYLKIVDPRTSYDEGLSRELIEPIVFDAPYPSIYTDADLNPIQGLWHNVGVAAGDTTLESMNRLRKLVRKMDRINAPKTIAMPGLEARIDTLFVYELPPDGNVPVIVTDQSSNYLYSRNVDIDPADTAALQDFISTIDLYARPIRFEKEGAPTIVFHSPNIRWQWPIVITGNDGTPLYWRDIVVSRYGVDDDGIPQLDETIRHFTRNGLSYRLVTTGIPVYRDWLFHYGDLPFLTMIGWLPIIELAVILILLSVAFIGFMNIKNAEQRSIWVGMAKETAHQLGTPISSLSGWFELLKTDRSDTMVDQALPEMEYDLKRLSRVAARFSSIGSKPELKPIDLAAVIDEVLDYYRARLPRMGKSVVIEGGYPGLRPVMGNTELLNWAFENLVKNALSAIESREGTIDVMGSMTKDFRHVILDFKDSGRGIAPSDQKNVMKPGFTTKKRGWGLGLSLVKRIIEDYHNGRLLLLESREGAGTTFRVVLPAIEKSE